GRVGTGTQLGRVRRGGAVEAVAAGRESDEERDALHAADRITGTIAKRTWPEAAARQEPARGRRTSARAASRGTREASCRARTASTRCPRRGTRAFRPTARRA